MVSPFTFYRGSAKIMAADLQGTPRAGLTVQLCGDAHLSNFGAFASPERQLLFDLNDFDETLPGPFEYDVKRLAASFMIAARNNGFTKSEGRAVTTASVTAYREAMAGFAQMRTMEVWYARLTEEDILASAGTRARGKAETKELKRAKKNIRKARTRDSLQALSKLAELVDGSYRIVSQPPIVVPLRDMTDPYGLSPEEVETALHDQFRAYRGTLQADRRHLLERFQLVVAEQDGRLVGAAQFDPADGRLRALFVDDACQGRGVGGMLLDEVEARAMRRGLGRVHGAMSLNAVPFYARHGFRRCAGPSQLTGRVLVPVVAMEKPLGAHLTR